ncbi:MAG: hypothetical protein WBE11_14455 [Candidatus Aminicenantaceae bacterium]
MKRTNIMPSDEQHNKLKRYAKKEGRTLGGLVREAGLLDVKLTGTLGILKKAVKHESINLNEGNIILAKI